MSANKGAKPKTGSASKGPAPASSSLKNFFKPQFTSEIPSANIGENPEAELSHQEQSSAKPAECPKPEEADVEMSEAAEGSNEQIQTK